MHTTSTRFFLRPLPLFLAALLYLGGCGGPTSVTNLRRSPRQVYTFEVPAACETVYQRLARRAQERYRHTNLATFQPGLTAQLAPDRRSATLTLFNAGGLDLRYLLAVDLEARDSARTGLTLFCADRAAAREALLWQQWSATPLERRPAEPNRPPAPGSDK